MTMKYPKDLICLKRILQSIAVLALVILPTVARADEIALWNFNDSNLVVDRGVGTLTLTANPANVTSLGGISTNARAGDPAGQSLAILAGANLQNNGSILELRASTVGFNRVTLLWDWQRSDTGFSSILLQYSIDGTTFLNCRTFSPPLTSFGGLSVTFGEASGVFDNPLFAFRWVLNGATNETGNIRFDNIGLAGTLAAVPEPATMVLLGTGLAGVAAKLRRRKKSRSL